MTEKDLVKAKELNKKIKIIEGILDDAFKHGDKPTLTIKVYENTREGYLLVDSSDITRAIPELKTAMDLINNEVLSPLLLNALTDTLRKLKAQFADIGKYEDEDEDLNEEEEW